ncbi:MAG: leucine-rich repeat domain-containing protein [Myxococcaceae bacterium]|nr:leucine-rich repeat domain-containing protein [Myxococcaceae bacterium]
MATQKDETLVRFEGAADLEVERSRTEGFWSAPGFRLPEGTRLAGSPSGWCVRCERPDGTLHGPATFWRRRWPSPSPAWTIEIQGSWRDGLRQGREVARRGEVICWEGDFVDGAKHGVWRYHDQHGALRLENHFDRGVLRRSRLPGAGAPRELEWLDGALVSPDETPLPSASDDPATLTVSTDGRTRTTLASVLALKPEVLWVSGAAHLPRALWTLRSLRELSIDGGTIARLPAELGNLENLEVLRLHSLPLGRLPPELGRLKKLRSLTVSFAGLIGLPAELTQLVGLETLVLDNNPLVALPDGIGACRSLRSLSLCNTRLESVPELLGDTPLDSFVANELFHDGSADGVWGQLRGVPASLSRCPFANAFELSGHLVTNLPDGLGAGKRFMVKNVPLLRLPRLRTDLRECHLSFEVAALETLPEWLGELKAFKLSFERNPLLAWPAALERSRLVKTAISGFKKTVALEAKIKERDAKLAAQRANKQPGEAPRKLKPSSSKKKR